MMTRREFGKLTLAAVALPRIGRSAINSTVNGVRLGVQTYSFRDLPRGAGDDAIEPIVNAIAECALGECELYAPQLEPTPRKGATARENLRTWRVETPLAHFTSVKQRFDTAGITIYAYNYSFDRSFSDAEIDRGFEIAKALGAEIITASTTIEVAKRVVPFAEKHDMIVAMHGHSNVTNPNELATPDSFIAALKMSRNFKVNLDIGHFTAANYDAVAFIDAHHADITNLHLKDRKKNQGDNQPWGAGDTPIREVLQLLKRTRWPIRAYIEYEYSGTGRPVEEVKQCYAYAKQALA